ncbi:hypothetical protein LMG27174_02290 [Paraburkholderia rhynchosiae]|uniref:D-methionine-binding lipoprotein MetQ n=1 Tax=Paraburkholderia rhynchosiae TaxID=487049 RepID=A0A6J5ARP5_9BURK|nr:hypothetical protein LMG27174_02290 [Paraburkholderia rhynchosiae]
MIEFNDYVQPNAALDADDLDANGFQHQPFLDSQIRQRGYRIVNVGLTYVSPMGFYSKKLKSLKDLPEGAKIGIQNEPSAYESDEVRKYTSTQFKGAIIPAF